MTWLAAAVSYTMILHAIYRRTTQDLRDQLRPFVKTDRATEPRSHWSLPHGRIRKAGWLRYYLL